MAELLLSEETLLERFNYYCKKRKQLRRILLRDIRNHSHLFENDAWLSRKIRLRYLGDLSDNDVVRYTHELQRKLEG